MEILPFWLLLLGESVYSIWKVYLFPTLQRFVFHTSLKKSYQNDRIVTVI